MAKTMRELIGIRNRQRDYLPEGRPLDQYSDAQRVEMTQDVHNPDSRNTPYGGTFVRTPSGAASARAPDPETLDRKNAAWAAVHEAAQQQGHAVFDSPLYRDAMLASAEAQGLDPSQYRDPLVLRDADATRDFDIMYNDVMREDGRRRAIEQKYTPVPAQIGKDGKPVAWKFAPRPEFQSQMQNQDQRLRAQQLFRNILDKHGRYVGPEMREQLRAQANSGNLPALKDAKQKLLADQRGNAAKNVADNWENRNITRTITNPDTAPGFVIRSTQGIAPHDRAALYTVLGWEPAAARETQAGIAQDAYNTQAAIASQQGGDAAPEDKSMAAQGQRHYKMLDMMISNGNNGIQTAIGTHARFLQSAQEGMTNEQAVAAAESEIVDRMAAMPQYRADPRVKDRMTKKAQEGQEPFLRWAASVGIPYAEASALYTTITRGPAATSTAGVGPANPITGL